MMNERLHEQHNESKHLLAIRENLKVCADLPDTICVQVLACIRRPIDNDISVSTLGLSIHSYMNIQTYSCLSSESLSAEILSAKIPEGEGKSQAAAAPKTS